MLSLNRLKSSVYAVNNLYGLIKSKDVSRYRLYNSISKAFSSSASKVLTSSTDKKLKKKMKIKELKDYRTETKNVPIILSKPHLVASNDTSDFIIKNEDDMITFTLNYMIRDEICDITRVMSNITNSETKQVNRALYKDSSHNPERYAYKVVVDAILATVEGKTLFPLKVPKVVILESKKRLCDALIMCVKKTTSCSKDQWKIEEQAEAVAYTITTLLPTNTCNSFTTLFLEYANGNVTKAFFLRQLFFLLKNHSCELECNMLHVVQSVIKFLDIVVDSDELWLEERKYKKKDCKKDFLSSLSAFLGVTLNSNKTSILDFKELRNTVTERMESNKIKELIVDLQTIREAMPSEKQLVAGEILLKRGVSPAASISSAIHIATLESIKKFGCIEFPLRVNIHKSEKSDIEISKSMARLLVSIKTIQTEQSSNKEEETLGLVIDNYVNKIDHQKLAVTLSKTICSDEKTSWECHNLLQEFVSRSCTALKLKEDLGILYTDNHAIYDKINSYLGLDQYNDNDSASLQLEQSTNVFDQFMLINELQYFVSRQAYWKQQYKVDAEFFSKANRAGNMRSFLDNMPKEKKKKIGHQLLYSTIMCASIKDGTTHIQLNDENDQVLPSPTLSASESIRLKIPKVFIDNLPSNVDEKIVKNAFKRCGSVAKVWVYKALDDGDHVPHESTKVINDSVPFKKFFDDDTSDDENNDGDRDDNSGTKKKIKLKVVKKKVKRPLRADSYAFVEMTDGEGFLKATRDENRIFGLCINSNNCRIQDSTKMQTLFVEFAVLLTTNEVKKMLKDIIGRNYELYCEDVNSEHNNSTSLFIHLEFVNHEEAWAAFQLIQKKTEEGAPIRAHWQKNKFWNLAREELFRYFSKTGDDAKIEELPKIYDKVNEI